MRSELIRAIAQRGLRVFDKSDITDIAFSKGLSKAYVPRMMQLMVKDRSLQSIGNGLYSLPTELLSGGPLHSFEVALKLAKKGSISHRSAMMYHELTDQIVSKVYVTVPKEIGANLSTNKEYNLSGTHYILIRVDPKNYWGLKSAFIGEARIFVTDLEKTLVDGTSSPEICGGFREVLYAFERGLSKVSPTQLFDYAQKTSTAACKRLGWILEQLGEYPDIQEQLALIDMAYLQRLDPSGKRNGKVNKRWNLMENI